MKLGGYYSFCTDQKNLQKISLRFWLTLFKHGKSLYESNKFINQFTDKLGLTTSNKKILDWLI